MERRLFGSGDLGYRLSNGASLCARHHVEAEQTVLSCDRIRGAAGITQLVLPDGYSDDYDFDKWGNLVLPGGRRSPGELYREPSVQKVLREGGVLDLFTHVVKYGRTPHLPWSPGATSDDKVLQSTEHFVGREVVVSEKIDGENSSLYTDTYHARSLDGRSHPSRDWIKALHARICHDIPEGFRLVGEAAYATHSISYDQLPSYFLLFAVYDDSNYCLSWDETEEWAALLDIPTVPVLYRGIWNEEAVKACFTGRSRFGGEQEGYVCRLAGRFHLARQRNALAKMVRAGHIQTDEHWMNKPVIPNRLAVPER